MNSKNRLQKLFRGWLPKEPSSLHSRVSKSTAHAYITGYGVGLGIGEMFIVIADLAGWGAFESILSPPFSLLAGMFVSFLGTMLALAIGAKLSRKLKERWIH